LDAEGRANVATLNDGAADPEVGGQAGSSQRIIECATARIPHEGVTGSAITIVCFQLLQVGDVFELARAIGGFARKGPIAVRRGRGTYGKTHDGSRSFFTREVVANEEIRRRPGLGESGNLGDGRVNLRGVREQSGRIRSGRGNFKLWRRLDASEFGRLIVAEPTAADENDYAKDDDANNERQKRIEAMRLGRSLGDARDIRHVRPKAGGWSIVGHHNKTIVLARWQREQIKLCN